MTRDLNPANRDYATYLPAISSVYARFCSDYYSVENSPRKGVLPDWMPHGFQSLDFLDKEKGIFHYDHALYSAGHAFLDPAKHDISESMVSQRPKGTFILGDSGGYQIASGILKFPWDDIKGMEADQIRHKIMTWLDHTSDYAMLLDFPTRAIDNERASLYSFKDCLEGSLINFDYFMRNRSGKAKYLNVMQGRSQTECDVWFDAIKDYPFEGWAFGGHTTRDFEITLTTLIKMRDGKYFEENSNGDKRNWLHFLGQSRLITSCAFTTIQKLLQEQVDPELRISFDSASAFIAVANGQTYTRDVFENKRFSYLMEKAYDDKALVGSDKPWPWQSAVGEKMRIGDICVKPEGWEDKYGKISKTSWDSFSYIMIMAHNVERHIKAIQQANRIYDLPHNTGKFLPSKLVEFKEITEEVFHSEKPMDVIQKHHKMLNNFAGLRMGKGVSMLDKSGDDNLTALFDFDTSSVMNDDGAEFSEIDEAILRGLEDNM